MAINSYDIVSTLQALGMMKYWKGKHIILKKQVRINVHWFMLITTAAAVVAAWLHACIDDGTATAHLDEAKPIKPKKRRETVRPFTWDGKRSQTNATSQWTDCIYGTCPIDSNIDALLAMPLLKIEFPHCCDNTVGHIEMNDTFRALSFVHYTAWRRDCLKGI